MTKDPEEQRNRLKGYKFKNRKSHSPTFEHRKKISIALKGKKKKPFSEEHKARIKEARKMQGSFSEETKKKLSEIRREEWKTGKRKGGWKVSEGGKINMRLAKRRKEEHWNWRGGISLNKIEYGRFCAEKRRIRKLGSIGSHTFWEWQTLKAQYNWTCPCCKRKEPEIKLTEDHIVPITKGGSDNVENIQPLCKSCNCKKYTKTIYYERS